MQTEKHNSIKGYNFKTKMCREIPVCFIIYKNGTLDLWCWYCI